MTIHEYNQNIFDFYNNLSHKDEMAKPLLVSPDWIDNKKILYIGQETNGWCNQNSVNELEKYYYNFMKNNHYYTNFWSFIKGFTSLDNVVWNNTLICGKRDSSGLTPYYQDIEKISLEYLLFLYEKVKPEKTIIVAGPNNPYYEIINTFNKKIGSSIVNKYPTSRQPIVADDNNGIYYSYHPRHLCLSKMTDSVRNSIK